VLPGTLVDDQADCVPGPTDCEIIAVAPDQMVGLSVNQDGTPTLVDVIAVASIYAKNYSSVAAAQHARHQESSTGAHVLNGAGLSALSLFQYRPSIGSVVDLRNLSVAGAGPAPGG